MPDNDILNNRAGGLDDFDLPPLPTRPVKTAPDPSAPKREVNVELPQMPVGSVKKPLDLDDIAAAMSKIPDPVSSPIPAQPYTPPQPEAAAEAVSAPQPEPEPVPEPEPEPAPAPARPSASKMPKMPSFMATARKNAEKAAAEAEAAARSAQKAAMEAAAKDHEEKKLSEKYDFASDYTEGSIDASAVKLAPMNSKADMNARNAREAQKMSSLAQEVGNGPLLDDLSDEYRDPEVRADDLLEKNKLDEDEKRILKQRLAADLGSRPKNFSNRGSQQIANKLLEEKKLKIAKKGFVISILPIFMGLGSAALAFFKLSWGEFQWFQFVAPFMALAAVLLLIRSKHVKLLAVSIYAICALIYVGPGLILFTLNNDMAGENVMHIILVIAAIVLNIVSILILIKNEAVNTYYSHNISRRR